MRSFEISSIRTQVTWSFSALSLSRLTSLEWASNFNERQRAFRISLVNQLNLPRGYAQFDIPASLTLNDRKSRRYA